MHRATVVGLVLATCLATAAIAETRKEFRFTVGPKANVSVDTEYGAITIKPGNAIQVVVVAVLQSDKVEVDHLQKGSRIEIESHLLRGADGKSGRVDYEITVPPDASVKLHSTTGPLTAERLHGDLTLEGAAAAVDVRNVSNGHVHIKTMNGPVTLTDVRNGHVEITSISGEVHLNSVTGPLVQVNSGSGPIYYNGDFGSGGNYDLSTETGNIDALVPPDASFGVDARSMRGGLENDFPFQPKTHVRFPLDAGRAFIGTAGKAASKVILRSFSGKIRLKQR